MEPLLFLPPPATLLVQALTWQLAFPREPTEAPREEGLLRYQNQYWNHHRFRLLEPLSEGSDQLPAKPSWLASFLAYYWVVVELERASRELAARYSFGWSSYLAWTAAFAWEFRFISLFLFEALAACPSFLEPVFELHLSLLFAYLHFVLFLLR